MPKEIISDQGDEVEGELFTELCKSINVCKLRISPYRPLTNGMVERYHRTLNQMLGKVVGETRRDWDLHVSAAAAAYRSSEPVVTGFTPNFMMLGREVRAPVEIVFRAPAGEEEFWTRSHEFVANAQQRYRKAHAIDRENLRVQASRRKYVDDRKIVKKKVSGWSMCVVFYPRRYKGRSPKWLKMYDGPMLIVAIISATNVKIQKSRNNQSQVVHVDELKVCRGETPSSWLFIGDGAEDLVAASEDEGVKESTTGDGTGNSLPDPMVGKQHDERPTGSTSGQLDDASTGDENEDGMSSSRLTRQRQPPAYLRDYLRTVREASHIHRRR